MGIKELWKLIFSIVVCQIIGFLGTFFTTPSIPTWYAGLIKPLFNPPNTIFMPVWIILYLLMGISLYLILRGKFSEKKIRWSIVAFNIQIVLNFMWSILFFGFRQPLVAFIEIVLLWLAIIFMIWQYRKVNKLAAYLQIPYFLWVTFAAILSLSIWILN